MTDIITEQVLILYLKPYLMAKVEEFILILQLYSMLLLLMMTKHIQSSFEFKVTYSRIGEDVFDDPQAGAIDDNDKERQY